MTPRNATAWRRTAFARAMALVRGLALLALAPIHPALMDQAARSEGPVRAWVVFRDKGPGGAERAEALVRAEAALTPRARARRERAGLHPLVDAYDLPVAEGHLRALRQRGFTPHAVSRWLNRAAVFADAGQLRSLAALPFVAGLEPVRLVRFEPEPSPRPGTPGPEGAAVDTSQYGVGFAQLAQLNLPAVHDSGYTGAGVLICVLDNGFTYHDTHEALTGTLIPPGHRRDFVDGDTTVTNPGGPDLKHGTQTMSCIAGNKPGAYRGGAYGATFALARTEDDFSETQVEMLYWGVGAEWADSLGADIITSSLGYSVFDSGPSYVYADMDGQTTDVSRAAQIAASKGMLVVNSAGNEGSKPWHYIIAPADVHGDSLIAAAAVDATGAPASFSSYGPSADGRIKPDLAARGLGASVVSVTGNPATYSTVNGTSFSAPLLTALAACVMQARPTWSAVTVIRALRETASQANTPDFRVGYGIPDGIAALQWSPVPLEATASPARPGLRLAGPNPVGRGAAARVTFALAAGGDARMEVRDALGRRVATPWRGVTAAGVAHTVTWDGRDAAGHPVRPGLYWIVLDAGRVRESVRLVVLR